MTTKIISGVYSNGYSLAAQFSGAYVTPSGAVTGSAGVYTTAGPGGAGGVAFTLPAASTTLSNYGVIMGGAGARGASDFVYYTPGFTKNGNYYPPTYVIERPATYGGSGGAGVSAAAKVRITNSGTIVGGASGYGGMGGVSFIQGGGGYYGEPSGAAGAGVILTAGGGVSNLGTIEGGYYSGNYGGVGGVGVSLVNGGEVINGRAGSQSAVIEGGNNVNGSRTVTIQGVGVLVSGPGTVINFGTISGEGAAAVQFTSPGGELVVYTGSTFIGAVDGGDGTLELATGSGTIGGTVSASGAVVETVGATTTTFSNFGALVLGSGSQFMVAATLTNSGSVVQSGILTMTGGTITNENGATWNIANGLDPTAAAGTFYNAGELTKTVGTGLVHVGVGFYNDYLGTVGVVDISLGALDFIGASNVFFGLVTGGGALVLGGGSSSLDGVLAVATVEVQGGSTNVTVDEALSYSGGWDQTGGNVSVASGDKLTLTGTGDSLSGALTGAGTVDFSGGSDTFKTLTLSAAHLAITKAAVTLKGSINLTGALTATTADLIVASGGAVLGGGGTLVLSNSASNSIEGASATARLTNEDKIQGAGLLGGGQMSLLNEATGLIIGADALDLVINTGAETIANAGLIESAGTGGVTIDSAIDNSGTLTAAKGTLTAVGAVSGAGKVFIEGGTADFQSTFAQSVTFTAAGGELELAKSQTYTGTITGFSKTSKTSLDLLDIAFGTGTKATYSGNTAAGVLTVTDGTHTAKIKLAGNYTTSTFTVSSDGHGGATVVDPPAVGQARAFVAAMAGFEAGGGSGLPASSAWRPAESVLATPG